MWAARHAVSSGPRSPPGPARVEAGERRVGELRVEAPRALRPGVPRGAAPPVARRAPGVLQPHHQRAVDEDDHVPLRRAAVRRGHDRRGRRRREPVPPHPVARRRGHDRGRCADVLDGRDHRVGAVADRCRVPRRRVGARLGCGVRERAPRREHDPRRRGGERDVRPRPAPHAPRRDVLVPEPVAVDELRDRRRAAAPRARAPSGSRPTGVCSTTTRGRCCRASSRTTRSAWCSTRTTTWCCDARNPEPMRQATASISPRLPSFRRYSTAA